MSAPAAQTESLRVLLVEDEALIALYTQDVLEDAGYSVVGPADRVEPALALASAEPLDAALLDVNLAGVKVWPVAELLRQRGIPFIFLSGLSSGSDIHTDFAMRPHLGKPFMPSALLAKLAEVISAAELNKRQ
jgi:CheY-like chemotaxis protein